MACKEPTNAEIQALAQAYIKATKEGASKIKAGRLVVKDETKLKRLANGVAEIYTSGLISGFTTHAVNAFMSTIYQTFQPTQKAIGRLLMGEPKEAMADMIQVYQSFSHARTSAEMALRSIKNERQYLDQGAAYIDQMGPAKSMSADAMGIDKAKNPIAAKAVDALGTVGRMTGHRVMGGIDEMFSQMNYRGHIESQYLRAALREGKTPQEAMKSAVQQTENHMVRFYKAGSLDVTNSTKRKLFTSKELTPEDILANDANKAFNKKLKAKYDAEKIVKPNLTKHEKEFNEKIQAQYNREKKRVVNERGLTELEEGINVEATKHNDAIRLHEEALEHSREIGFKANLDPDASLIQAVGNSLQKLVENHPLGRIMFVPFLRTPTHLLEVGVQNTPALQFMNKAFRDNLLGRNGAAKKSQAVGQLTTGALATAAMIPFIENGSITGSISSDWKVNQNAADAGVQPYSFIFKGSDGKEHSVQYNYLDPVMFSMGMLADLRQEMRKHDIDWQDLATSEDLSETWQQFVLSLGATSTHYVYNKSYFQGIANMMDVAKTEPDQWGEAMARYARKQASSFVPNMLSQANQMFVDESRRESRTILEAFKAKLPLLSQSLPLKYDPLGVPSKQANRFYAGLPLRNSEVSTKLDRRKKDDFVKAEIFRLALKTDSPVRPFSPMNHDYKIDYRTFFPYGSKEGESGTSFYDAVNRKIFEEGKITDQVYDLVTNEDYQSIESNVVSVFDDVFKDSLDPTDFPSKQMAKIKKILKDNRDRVKAELLNTEEWAHVRDAVVNNKIANRVVR